MKTVVEIQGVIHKRCLQFRAMDRLVNSVAFKRAFELDPSNAFVQFALQSGNVGEIEAWIDRTLTRDMDIAEMSLRELRQLASKVGILFYTTFTKDELIVLIAQKQNDLRRQEAAG